MKWFRGKTFKKMSRRFYSPVKLAKPFDRVAHEDPSETLFGIHSKANASDC